jgi:RHS repeat-associated protein
VIDNVAPAFSATGTWPASTSVSGYVGPNYQSHVANGPLPSGIVVDNSDSGFSVTGTWAASTSVSGYLGANYQHHFANGAPPASILADNASGSATGTWPASTSVSGYLGSNYQVHAAGTGANAFTWPLNVANAGSYEVYARWTQHPNRATNAKYTVNHDAGPTVVTVNQEAGGGTWQLLGTYSFSAGATTISLSDDANDYVIADAVMLVPPGAAPNTATWTLAVASSGTYNVYARWTAHPNRATDAKYTVNHAGGASLVTANQEANSGTWNLLGTYTFNAGSATVSLTDQANGYVIADAVMLAPPGAAPNTATWTPNVAQAGTYEVYARWTQHANRATNATYTVTHGQGATSVAVNQQANGAAWNLLGSFQLSPGTAHKVELTDQANGYVIADAIRLVPISLQTELKLYFVHADHLNTPRLVADATGTTVWRWDQVEPFGVNVPDENPSGLGVFDLPLRLPGQVHDKETNLHYNYFRDYDPSIGRYVESDPIGTFGGLNTYTYGDGSPLQAFDFFGLCRIEVRFKPIPGIGAKAKLFHAYIVTSDPSGSTPSYFRGGPDGPRSISNPVWGAIKTTTGLYTQGTQDWDPGTPPSVTVLDNEESCTCYDRQFATTLKNISNSDIGYIPGFQNSNSVVGTALTQSGFSLPSIPVTAPGFTNNLSRYFYRLTR